MSRTGIRLRRPLAIVVSAIFVMVGVARAGDIESAKKYLEQARQQVKDQSWSSIDDTFKMVDEFLDGVPDADKAPVAKELADLRMQAAAGVKTYKAKGLTDRIDRELSGAADDSINLPASALPRLDAIKQLINSDDAKKYLDPAVTKKYLDRIAGLHQTAIGKVKKEKLTYIAPLMEDLEKQVADNPFKGKEGPDADHAVQTLNSLMSRVRGMLDGLPPDDADVKAINVRLAAADKQINTLMGGAAKSGEIDQLAKHWANTKEYFAGWEKETATPTWERFSKESSNEMSALLMPKTLEALDRVKSLVTEPDVIEKRKTLGGEPAAKATFDDMDKTLDTAGGKVSKAFNSLLDEAEKLPTPTDQYIRNKAGYMVDDAVRFFTGTKFLDANVARAQKLKDKWAGSVAADEKGREELYAKMSADATAAWPAIAAAIPAETDINPTDFDKLKGKTIRLKHRNRAGWDYDAAYDFAMAINGIPIAGKFQPNVRAAMVAAQQATHKDLPDDQAWDVIGVIDGKGVIKERTNTDITEKSSGQTVGKIEGYRPVDCVVFKITAMHIGPIAVGPGGSAVATPGAAAVTPALAASGGAGAAEAAAESSGSGWGSRIFWLLVAFGASAVAFLKARPQAVGQLSGGGTSPVGGFLTPANIAYAGLAFAALGIIQLLLGILHFHLLTALAVTACGAYAAGDFLEGRGILPAHIHAKAKPFGLILAVVTDALALLTVVTGGLPLL